MEQVDGEARAEFARLLEIANRPLWDEERARVEQDRLNLERYVEWKRLNPGKKVPHTPGAVALQLGERDDAIKKPYVERAKADYERRKAERESAEERMRELAPDIVLHVQPCERAWVECCRGSTSAYPNQTANAAYSRTAVLLQAAGFEQHVPVRELLAPDLIIVEAAVADAFEVEVLKRLPGLTLREWLKRCMQLGANPRVYNPFLPHGLEARLGLDYFGNDVKPPA